MLEAGGYRVDAAATAAEAVGKMEDQEYQLVLSDLQMESPEAGLKVLAHAQLMDYKPATALITSYHNTSDRQPNSRMLVEPQDVPGLLSKVANLIARRVTRREYVNSGRPSSAKQSSAGHLRSPVWHTLRLRRNPFRLEVCGLRPCSVGCNVCPRRYGGGDESA